MKKPLNQSHSKKTIRRIRLFSSLTIHIARKLATFLIKAVRVDYFQHLGHILGGV